MDRSKEYYAERNKLDTERQIPYDFTYMRNLKDKINEQAKQKQSHRYREQLGHQMGGGGLWVKKMKRLKSTNWKIIKIVPGM